MFFVFPVMLTGCRWSGTLFCCSISDPVARCCHRHICMCVLIVCLFIFLGYFWRQFIWVFTRLVVSVLFTTSSVVNYFALVSSSVDYYYHELILLIYWEKLQHFLQKQTKVESIKNILIANSVPSKIFVSRLVSKKCRQDQKKLRRPL